MLMRCSFPAFCAPLGLDIAEAAREDLPDLLTLISDIYHEYRFPESLRWYEEDPDLLAREALVDPSRGASHLLRSSDGAVVGAGILIPRLDPDTPRDAEISHLYLRPAYRGRGLGRALLDDLLVHASDAGYRSVYLVSRHELVEALHLYERNGFTRIRNERYPDRPWLLEMTRPLS